ncbi:hypothetical protein N7493_004928 [Penicillium malachiteum]|uniref:Uncharacterized protein n=1 Tax=Penicillium malachiteum TaxID=1324776 RepID=A0AAD6MW32_9EURO|nr:hypothetical protein N7493_004928 [Penicillium malachiteum]
MESTDDPHESALRSPSPKELEQTRSPQPLEPLEPVLDTEELLLARLTQGLEQYDWDKLQEKYTDAMDEHSRVEEDLRAQTTNLLDVSVIPYLLLLGTTSRGLDLIPLKAFTAWSQTAVLQDEQRALKR